MIDINGEIWKILLVASSHPCLQRSNGEYALGACDDVTKTIYINQELEPTMIKKVLCHELTHAAMFSYNVELSYDQEELLADLIATYGQEIIYNTNNFVANHNNF
jgi:hypothetical protein